MDKWQKISLSLLIVSYMSVLILIISIISKNHIEHNPNRYIDINWEMDTQTPPDLSNIKILAPSKN